MACPGQFFFGRQASLLAGSWRRGRPWPPGRPLARPSGGFGCPSPLGPPGVWASSRRSLPGVLKRESPPSPPSPPSWGQWRGGDVPPGTHAPGKARPRDLGPPTSPAGVGAVPGASADALPCRVGDSVVSGPAAPRRGARSSCRPAPGRRGTTRARGRRRSGGRRARHAGPSARGLPPLGEKPTTMGARILAVTVPQSVGGG